MKFVSLVFFSALGVAKGISEEEICKDVWAYDPNNNKCTKEIGADYWGWTNGRYGTSGCENCECEDCPTPPPTPSDPPTPAPTPPPVPLPQQCLGLSGGFSGDPHMLTFDQLEYDCQGEGEFHLLKSLDSDFEIQGRFRNFFADQQLTVGSSVVWNSGDAGDPIIQASVGEKPKESLCIPEVMVDGVTVEDPGSLTHIAPGIQIKSELKRKNGSAKYIIYHQRSGLEVQVLGKAAQRDSTQCTMLVQVCLPKAWPRSHENLVGLLGNADGDMTNEWKIRDGSFLPVPTEQKGLLFTEAYNFCTQWCIASASASLFLYDETNSWDSINKNCQEPANYEAIEDCVFDPPEDIKAVCGRKAYACLTDACVASLPEVGESQLESEIELADKGCGTEIGKYDFTEEGAEKLGDIQMLYESNPFLALTSTSSKFAYRFPVASLSQMVQIDFKFIESGDWDKTSTETDNADYVYLTIDGVQLDLLGFDKEATEGNPEEEFSGVKEGILWERRAITETGQDFGLPTSKFGGDQMHVVTAYVPRVFYDDGFLDLKFEAKVDDPNEVGGVDDIRITSFGTACNVPANPEVKDDLSIDFDKACSMQILYENFQNSDTHVWGKIETMRENNYLVMDKSNTMLSLTHNNLPADADAVMFEFDVYLMGTGWAKCAESACTSKLKATFGDDTVNLSIFDNIEKPEAEKSAFGISWSRTKTTDTMVHIEIIAGSKYFDGGVLSYVIKAELDESIEDVYFGIDEFRVTTFRDNEEEYCPAPPVELAVIGDFEPIEVYDEPVRMRRNLREFFASPHYMPRKYVEKSRKLFFEVDTDTCTCVCPIIPDGPTKPTTMPLYFKTENESCTPESGQIGTVTMTPMQDGTIEFKYDVDPKYDLQGANIYVGETRLPVNELTGEFLLPDEFPYADDVVTGQSATYTVDPTVCDFYAAIHAKVCGDFPTPPPAPTPAPTPSPDPNSSGDPHFLTWGGEKFDFHGGCDLVLLDNPSFHDGLGMTIHIRTKINTWWSYIETAVVRVGNETLEITGGEDKRYLINGVRGDNNAEDFVFSAAKLRVHLKQASAKQLKVRIDLLNADAIGLEVFKDFVKVNAHMTDPKWKKFEGSVGMLGSYPDGRTVGRDGTTLFTDMNEYGQEWQVREDEPKLFSVVEGPQHPAKCQIPAEIDTAEKRRRLGQSMISMEDAEIACSRVDEDSRDACIFDVLATNDIEMAGSY